MYYQNEVDSADKKQRGRIIAVATALAVVILLLIVAIIVAATNKVSKSEVANSENTAFEMKDDEEKQSKVDKSADAGRLSTKTEEDTAKNGSETSKAETSDKASTSTETSMAESSSEMPVTGPFDMLPIALMLGALTTCVSSYAIAKREQ